MTLAEQSPEGNPFMAGLRGSGSRREGQGTGVVGGTQTYLWWDTVIYLYKHTKYQP